MGDYVKGLTEIQVDDISGSCSLMQLHHRKNKVGQAGPALGEAVLAIPYHLLLFHMA